MAAFTDKSELDEAVANERISSPTSGTAAKTLGERRRDSGTIAAVRPPRTMHRPRIIIADRDKLVRERLRPVLRRLHADIVEADSGDRLEQLLGSEGPFDLVVTNAQLPSLSGLQVLARSRSNGVLTPFIVITSHHGLLLRIFVSDTSGTVLSSRVVDPDNLAVLADNLMKASVEAR